jgi:hypothetical protein
MASKMYTMEYNLLTTRPQRANTQKPCTSSRLHLPSYHPHLEQVTTNADDWTCAAKGK